MSDTTTPPVTTPAPVATPAPAAPAAPAAAAPAVVPPVTPAAPAAAAPTQPALPGVAPAEPVRTAEPERRSYTADEISKRVEREVNHRVKKLLGMDAETAVAKLRQADELQRLANDGSEKSQQLQAVIDQLRGENSELRAQINAERETVTRVKRKAEDETFIAKVRTAVARAGVDRAHEDFAIFQFRAAIQKASKAKQPIPKASEFFAGLRRSHPMLFTDAQVTVPVVPSTAGPDAVPGTTPPTPTPPEARPPGANADEMDDSQFRQHTKSKYNFSFGH